ncbi:MAG: imidazole glycerol phosphate synthase subunit HisH [Clostridia bacterium]|nr:imidazole glycerol phosphate synthase subunit HisH [Clostridia bacterium]
MTAIVDYGVGNLFSLKCSLSYIGEKACVTGSPEEILAADRIILPGVGAFGDAAAKLRETGLDDVILRAVSSGKPLLGICLGMQLLFDESLEFGVHKGLGLIPGRVVPLEEIPGWDTRLKIPHIGWNSLEKRQDSPLLKYTADGEYVYFVHSFYAEARDEDIAAVATYGGKVTAVVQHGNVFGCQFHPEKSGNAGLAILRAFCGIGGDGQC